MTKRIKTKDLKPQILALHKALTTEQDRIDKTITVRKEELTQKEVDRINSSWIYKFLKKKTKETAYFPSFFFWDMEFDFIISSLNYDLKKITKLKRELSYLIWAMRDDSLEQEYDLPVTLIEDIKYYYKKLCNT